VPIDVRLLDQQGRQQRGLPDPAGGTFDAAGDFDRLLEIGEAMPVWSRVDPYDEIRVTGPDATALLSELDYLDTTAHDGPERRGLARLRVMAERCRDDDRLALLFVGD
jgi:hypothetical protein